MKPIKIQSEEITEISEEALKLLQDNYKAGLRRIKYSPLAKIKEFEIIPNGYN